MALSVEWPYELKTLDLRGRRGALGAEEARTLLSDVFSGRRTDYERVIVSTWALSVDSALVIVDAMKLLPDLKSMVLADMIAGRPEAEGLAVFRAFGAELENRKILEIDLSDNAVGPKGVDACYDMLKNQSSLERLFVCNCGISAEAARSIADILLRFVPSSMKVLHFDNNMSGGGGAIAIADIIAGCPVLEDFRFTSSRGTREGGVALASAFSRTPLIKKINLSDNLFSEVTAAELAKSLPLLKRLEHLDLSDTILKNAGLNVLAPALVQGCAESLKYLGLSLNELSAGSCISLARLVVHLPNLSELNLADNELGEVGLNALAAGLLARSQKLEEEGRKDQLRILRVPVNYGGYESVRNLVCVAVRVLPALELLDVSANDVEDEEAMRLRAFVHALSSRRSSILQFICNDEDGEPLGLVDGQEEGEDVVVDEDDLTDAEDETLEDIISSKKIKNPFPSVNPVIFNPYEHEDKGKLSEIITELNLSKGTFEI